MQVLLECNLAQTISDLLNGKTVILPTETSYGLGCDATNQEAADKIFKIKGRTKRKPLLVVVPSVKMAKKYLEWNESLEKIAGEYWPGPVTVVGKIINHKSKIINQRLAIGVVSGDTLALRVTAHPLLKRITELMGRPLVATSANPSGAGEIYEAKEIIKVFSRRKHQPDILIDAGKLPKRKPSTIVSVAGGKLEILRQGEIKISITKS